MKKDTIRLAVLGTGPRWRSLTSVYLQHPNVEVVALCDISSTDLSEAAAELKKVNGSEARLFSSYEEMTKGAVYDAIMIACDPDIQVEYAVAEMERGIHVMTEVPAAYTIEQCHSLVRAVERTGVKYQLAEQTRYWNFIEKWREMAARGELGTVYYAEGEYLHYEPQWDFFRNKNTLERVWTDDQSYESNPEYERTWRYRTFTDPSCISPTSFLLCSRSREDASPAFRVWERRAAVWGFGGLTPAT